MADIKNKEENGGHDTSNKKFSFPLENNYDEETQEGRIYKYTNYSQTPNSPSDHGGDQCRQNQPAVSSPGKGVHQAGTDLAHDQSSPGMDKSLSGDSEMAALSPIHRLLERNALRSAGAVTPPDETAATCSKLTSVRRPNQVTSGWI